jgi:hypothetical protein
LPWRDATERLDEKREGQHVKRIELPAYRIILEVSEPDQDGDRSGRIVHSELMDGTEPPELKAALDALESIVLAHACEGIDVTRPAYLCGFETAVEVCLDHLQ